MTSLSVQDAASAAAMGAPRAEGFELDLIGCASAWLADTALLIGLATGQLVLLNLEFEGSRARRMKVSPHFVDGSAHDLNRHVHSLDLIYLTLSCSVVGSRYPRRMQLRSRRACAC